MINSNVLTPRFEALEEYLEVLRRIAKYSMEEFLSEPERYGAAERFLQLSIEAIDDIGSHIIADKNLGRIDTYSDIPRILSEHGIVPEALSSTWRDIIGFRNILVHDYLKLDRSIVYDILKHKLSDFVAIQKCLAVYL
jgi:uncharacterized protein YutE (UPF0331/DUF86 family)